SVFFFRAEDGIRDLTVTGVQTCALPISSGWSPGPVSSTAIEPGSARTRTTPPGGVRRSAFSTRFETTWSVRSPSPIAGAGNGARSEERRVGKRVERGGGRMREEKTETEM